MPFPGLEDRRLEPHRQLAASGLKSRRLNLELQGVVIHLNVHDHWRRRELRAGIKPSFVVEMHVGAIPTKLQMLRFGDRPL